jgi:hypothetical protein
MEAERQLSAISFRASVLNSARGIAIFRLPDSRTAETWSQRKCNRVERVAVVLGAWDEIVPGIEEEARYGAFGDGILRYIR